MRLFNGPLQEIRFYHCLPGIVWNEEGLDLVRTEVSFNDALELRQADGGASGSTRCIEGAQYISLAVFGLFEDSHHHALRLHCDERVRLRQRPIRMKGGEQRNR